MASFADRLIVVKNMVAGLTAHASKLNHPGGSRSNGPVL